MDDLESNHKKKYLFIYLKETIHIDQYKNQDVNASELAGMLICIVVHP